MRTSTFRLPDARRARHLLLALAATLVVAVVFPLVPRLASAQEQDCSLLANPIPCENAKPGTSAFEWSIEGAGDPDLQGFATEISVQPGETIDFKIDTSSRDYFLNIYRLGWYDTQGARLIEGGVAPSAKLPQTQPECLFETETRLTDCGNWAVSASWTVPTNAVSGVYFAHVKRNDTDGQSHIVFVVRDEARASDVLFQTSDTTWQAYNRYGGYSLYPQLDLVQENIPRAFKVSYNRPFTTADYKNQDWLFNAEYPMIRYLERNGFDVTYTSGIDTDRGGVAELTEHQVFLSVGHDEYWSEAQRENVEAARDQGVHLQFLGGNDVYWKTRYEPDIAGGTNPYRTLVSYKETFAGAKIDPSEEWTGTWRDLRFSPPFDGGRPENELIGTIFTVNAGTSFIEVPHEDGQMRFWRNSEAADLRPGEVLALTENSLGYEWNEDLDNGFRPAGTFRLSHTERFVPDKLADPWGATTEPANATHNMTMYRAASGALVFSAGSIQWPYALMGSPSGAPASPAAKQAQINLFADMGVQPATLEATLVPATASTDTTAPTTTITDVVGAQEDFTVQVGSNVTITGTASDVGGRVGGVEVTTDGGASWHRAEGRETWSYEWVPDAIGEASIQARAVDDSANLGAPTDPIVETVTCPCSLFPATAVPNVVDSGDYSGIELGVKFSSDIGGNVTAIRFYKSANNTGLHRVSLWDDQGNLLGRADSTTETASGWQEVSFPEPVPLNPGATYVASYHAPNGGYSFTRDFFTQALDVPPLRSPAASTSPNGVYRYGFQPTFPNQSFGSANYFVDPVVTESDGLDTFAPVVAARTPLSGAVDVATTSPVSVTFNEDVAPATIGFSLVDEFGAAVAGQGAYDQASRTYTFTPDAPLAGGTSFDVTVSGVADLLGNTMSVPSTWTFTTAGVQVCPCTLFPAGAEPVDAASTDGQSVEVGTRFTSDEAGFVLGVRFWKGPGNGGTHVGNLWDLAGNRLATGTFVDETTSGWQELRFDQPVPVSAGTIYVVSYFAPQGRYAFSGGYFTEPVNSVPLRAVVHGGAPDSTDDVNGVYAYGASSLYPANGGGGSSYWVEPIFSQEVPPDEDAPQVLATTPAPGATGTGLRTPITVRFDELVDVASIATSLSSPEGDVPVTVTWDEATKTARLVPDRDLALETTYTATLSSVADLAGNLLGQATTWSFTTKGCPCTLFAPDVVPSSVDSGDYSSLELGVQITPTVSGAITAIRFYEGPSNSGTKKVNLWSATGELLGSADAPDVPGSGWREVPLPSPVPVVAGETYVASYFAPNGGYAVTGGFFADGLDAAPVVALGGGQNGRYRYGGQSTFPNLTFNDANYWVDAVLDILPPDAEAPTVVGTAPADGADDASPDGGVSVTFSELVDPPSVSIQVTRDGGAPLAGTTTYDSGTSTATFVPEAGLASSATYAVAVTASDLSGNAMAAPVTFGFTTADPECPCTLFDGRIPPSPDGGDDTPTELGVRFTTDVEGEITGVRFYKSIVNTGTHTGTLWSSTGQVLATGTFTDETGSGWQELTFAQPVPVVPGEVYVASYFAPRGRYSADYDWFADTGTNLAPLHAPASAVVGGNGVFRSGGAGFPDQSFRSTNYWVEPVLQVPLPVADLSVAAATTTLTRGQSATTTATVSSAGPEEAPGPITLTVSTTAGVTPTAAAGTGWACAIAGRVVTCETPGPLAPGAQLPSVQVTSAVAATAGPDATVTAAVSTATSEDPDPTDDTATRTSPIGGPSTTLRLARQGDTAVDQGQRYRVQGYVFNDATTAAPAGFQIRATIPEGSTFVTFGRADWTCTNDATTVTCTYGKQLDPGKDVYVDLDFQAGLEAFGTIPVDLRLVSTRYDTTPGDDVVSSTIEVRRLTTDAAAELRGDAEYQAGSTFKVQAYVANLGPDRMGAGSTVRVPIPTGTTFVSSSRANWSCSSDGTAVTCTFANTINSGADEHVDLVFQAAPDRTGPITVDLTVTSPTHDPNPGNDAVQRTVTQKL